MRRKLIDVDDRTLEKIKLKAVSAGKSPKKYIESLIEEDADRLSDVSAGCGYRFTDIGDPSEGDLRALMYKASLEVDESNRRAEEEFFCLIAENIRNGNR